MTSTATIRFSTLADMPQILELLMLIREETFWYAMTPDLVQMESWILREGYTNPHFCILVAEDVPHGTEAAQLVGLCGVYLIEHALAPGVKFLAEWAFYVRPGYRDQGVKFSLWRAVKAWAKEQGAVGTVNGRWQYWGAH